MAAKTEKGLKQEIVNLFPVRLRQILEALPLDFARLEEIRLRCGQPILFRIAGKEMGITGSGDLTELGSSGKLDNWEKLERIKRYPRDHRRFLPVCSRRRAAPGLFYSPGRSPDRGCRESDIKRQADHGT